MDLHSNTYETTFRGGPSVGRAARGQHDRICRALRFLFSKVMLECSFWNTTSAETKLRPRAIVLRERKTVKVSWWGRPQALPNDRGVGHVLSEKGRKVRAISGQVWPLR